MKRLAPLMIFGLWILIPPTRHLAQEIEGDSPDTPSLYRYAGRLTDQSGEGLTGEYEIVFRIYDSPVASTPLWEESSRVDVVDGKFEAFLGRQTPIRSSPAGTRYVAIVIDGEELSPRYVVPAPITDGGESGRGAPAVVDQDQDQYAPVDQFDDRYVNEGQVSSITSSMITDDTIVASDIAADAVGAIEIAADAVGSSEIATDAVGSPEIAAGSVGTSEIADDAIVDADISASAAISPSKISGTAWTSANDGAGSGLDADLLDGVESGSLLRSVGPDTISGTGTAAAVLTVRNTEGGVGLHSEATGSTGAETRGVRATSSNTSTGDVYGGHFVANTEGTGQHYGVFGEGWASSISPAYGSYGAGVNTGTGNAYGGYFSTYFSGSGGQTGVYGAGFGMSFSPTYGAYGFAENTSSGETYGGFFSTFGTGTGSQYGLYAIGDGTSSNPTYGAIAYANNADTGDSYGGYFASYSTGSGTHYGVYGYEPAGGTGAAVYASGDMIASGAKPAVVKTSSGHRLLYAQESPEVWFEDFGEGKFRNDRARVELDPLFLETVTIDGEHPMKVFVQLTGGNPTAVVVEKGLTGFTIRSAGQPDGTKFDWRVVAKRKRYEDHRFEETDAGHDDPNLYPELLSAIEARREEDRRRNELERRRHEEEAERLEQARRDREPTNRQRGLERERREEERRDVAERLRDMEGLRRNREETRRMEESRRHDLHPRLSTARAEGSR